MSEAVISKIKVNGADYTIKDSAAASHIANLSNPHNVTKAQIGLGNVENKSSETIRGEITSANVTGALGYTPINPNTKGQANGVASLDGNGKVPAAQLPSFVDDVVPVWNNDEQFFLDSEGTTPVNPESGKIYIEMRTNKSYRYKGTGEGQAITNFVEISSSLALGTTSSSAFRGDYGQTAYSHATETKSGAKSSGLYKISVTSQGHVGGVTAVTKADITALGIPGADTHYTAKIVIGDSYDSIADLDNMHIGGIPSEQTHNMGYLNIVENGRVSDYNAFIVESPLQFLSSAGQIDLAIVYDRGLNVVNGKLGHSNSITAGATSLEVNAGGHLVVGGVNFDAYGHITSKEEIEVGISAPTITVTPSSASTLTGVATAGTTPSWSASVANETLSFSFSAGAMPTFNTGNRLTGVTASASEPEFYEQQ